MIFDLNIHNCFWYYHLASVSNTDIKYESTALLNITLFYLKKILFDRLTRLSSADLPRASSAAVFREVIRGSLPRQLFSSGILDLSDLPRQPSVACSASMLREQPGISFDKHVFRGSSADVFRTHCFPWGFLIWEWPSAATFRGIFFLIEFF